MRNAYALLGFAFLILFVGAYIIVERAHAPSPEPEPVVSDTMSLSLTSPSFEHNGSIPPRFTCDGTNINPELRIAGVPEGTKSLVLLMDDPDIPEAARARIGQDAWDHFVLYNIEPTTTVVPEGRGSEFGGVGLSSRGEAAYSGPCPPDREHRYFFRLYALSTSLNFIKAPTLREVKEAIKEHIIEETELVGRYERVQ